MMSQKMESIPIYESHTFTEIVERLSIHLNDKLLLIDHLATHNNKMYIDIIKGDHIDSDVPTVLRFDTVSEVKLLESWISKKRIPRVFNLNPKHGENGTHVIANKGEKVEMLRCSRHEATNLLTIAKGDKRLTKELYAFDTNHNKFIVFKDENTPNNSYHGYHVDNENEVPKKIRDILRPND